MCFLLACSCFVTLNIFMYPGFFPLCFLPSCFPSLPFLSGSMALLYLSCLVFFVTTSLFAPVSTPPPALLPSPHLLSMLLHLSLLRSRRHREEVWADSSSSHLCTPIGQRWSGAAGERTNHVLRSSAGRQQLEGEWSHPCLEIWPSFR